MNPILRAHAEAIVRQSIQVVLPDEAVRRALRDRRFPGRVFLVAAGKAAWQMARAAVECIGGIAGGMDQHQIFKTVQIFAQLQNR